ncbi:cytochrome c peroxidase [Paraburkholderia fungorum]|uniref:Cytochrome c peroxidase n=1 Tax=Paraburkholderia fungorum TaxID=134537 RepID=A0A1H1HU63_9BURK|nr:cytochrome c peroxidase [Paraburkholderia fungorum]SDR28698.1 cytochrome c peroxidase [Paraburkholderia fungorum]
MSTQPLHPTPSTGSTQRNEPPGANRPRGRQRLLVGCTVALVAVAGLAGYALAYPERMPDSVGEIVENLTGANPHPVQLVLPAQAPLSAVAKLGKQIFYDTSLSASGRQSCASCHSPTHAYGPPNDLDAQLGGPHLDRQSFRPPPSLAYLYRQAVFSIGPDAADAAAPPDFNALAQAAQGTQRADKVAGTAPATVAMVPVGGMFWDGRADTYQRQALGPLINPTEMANADSAAVAAKLARAPYAASFRKLFGPGIFNNADMLTAEAMFAVGRYEFEQPDFHAFTSKYDYWLRGKARLTHAELHGLNLFNDPKKANCAGCHLSQPSSDGLSPLFTDTQYEALGVPRNTRLEANRDPKFFDFGLCGPLRQDLAKQTQYCGMFLTPTLRNSANRNVYFHNGVYHDLKQVMDFYNLRNTSPDRIYPKDAAGKVQKYDDLPAQYHANVDIADAPFDRKYGDQPAMSDQDIQDIIAFLHTLNDGYKP